MIAENTTTPHNRTIHLTGILSPDGKNYLPEMWITVNYTVGSIYDSITAAAVTLDQAVIPEIIHALNATHGKWALKKDR